MVSSVHQYFHVLIERYIGVKTDVNEESVGGIGRHSSAHLGLVHSDLGVVFLIV